MVRWLCKFIKGQSFYIFLLCQKWVTRSPLGVRKVYLSVWVWDTICSCSVKKSGFLQVISDFHHWDETKLSWISRNNFLSHSMELGCQSN